MPTAAKNTPALVEVEPGSAEMAEVLSLHRRDKAFLGFLPDAGFDDRAISGTLLGAVSQGRVVGYVLYDLPGDWVKIVHLCVAGDARGNGVARLLVGELSVRHPSRAGIHLACRRSYPASDLWPKLGFRPIGDRPGRSLAGHRLTVWLFDHGHPDLFSQIEDSRETAALDQMVFEDLIVGGTRSEESRHLLSDWIEEMVELCVTDQIFVESNACTEEVLRDQLIAAANGWRNISPTPSVRGERVAEVANLAPLAGAGDHRHIALASAGGAAYFVTRDSGLLAAAQAIRNELQLEVLRPEQLIDQLDRQRRVGLYVPAALAGTTIVASRLPGREVDTFSATLLSNGGGERVADLRRKLRVAVADTARNEVLAFGEDERLLAGVVRLWEDQRLCLKVLRVAGSGQLPRALARQLVFAQRQAAATRRVSEVCADDPMLSPLLREALRAEYFSEAHDGTWRCRAEFGFVGTEQLSSADPMAAAALERARWPVKVLGAGLPIYIVSIKPPWAEELFDEDLASQTLFPRPLGLGLSREHVYYRKTRPTISAPARICWYVTAGHGHPVGHLRAVSLLSDVFTAAPEQLYRRFERLGVWTLPQVRAAADRAGDVMAMRFVDTELLAKPLDLYELQRVYAEVGLNFQAPLSPQAMREDVFSQIYSQSSAYA